MGTHRKTGKTRGKQEETGKNMGKIAQNRGKQEKTLENIRK